VREAAVVEMKGGVEVESPRPQRAPPHAFPCPPLLWMTGLHDKHLGRHAFRRS
jgi:hypothetical protein